MAAPPICFYIFCARADMSTMAVAGSSEPHRGPCRNVRPYPMVLRLYPMVLWGATRYGVGCYAVSTRSPVLTYGRVGMLLPVLMYRVWGMVVGNVCTEVAWPTRTLLRRACSEEG
eukprot:3940384-Rhodomonas_salina.1